MIVRQGRRWILYTHDGGRVLGEHDSIEAAVAQERAIQIARRKRFGRKPPALPRRAGRPMRAPRRKGKR